MYKLSEKNATQKSSFYIYRNISINLYIFPLVGLNLHTLLNALSTEFFDTNGISWNYLLGNYSTKRFWNIINSMFAGSDCPYILRIFEFILATSYISVLFFIYGCTID